VCVGKHIAHKFESGWEVGVCVCVCVCLCVMTRIFHSAPCQRLTRHVRVKSSTAHEHPFLYRPINSYSTRHHLYQAAPVAGVLVVSSHLASLTPAAANSPTNLGRQWGSHTKHLLPPFSGSARQSRHIFFLGCVKLLAFWAAGFSCCARSLAACRSRSACISRFRYKAAISPEGSSTHWKT
jgi:hypothetical protein